LHVEVKEIVERECDRRARQNDTTLLLCL